MPAGSRHSLLSKDGKKMAFMRGRSALYKGLLLVLFVFIVFMAYSNTFTSPPHLDDFHSFIYDKTIYINDLSFSSILSLINSKFGIRRFIPVVTLALNHKLGQSNLVYFHLVNILIHVLSFLAVYFLTVQIVSAARRFKTAEIPAGVAAWLPLGVAALWALNPAQTNAVTYLVQRMTSIMGLFYFLAVGCYIKARIESESCPGKAFAYYIGFALSALCAFMSKENSALLPFSIILTEIWFFDSEFVKKSWSFFRRHRVASLVACLAGAVCLFYVSAFLYKDFVVTYPRRHFNMIERVMTEWRVLIWYISILFWPDPSRLSIEHYVELSTSLFNPATTFFSLLAIIGLIAGSIYYRKQYPVISFGILWYFLNLSMESTIIPLELVFEHRLYIPSSGLFLSALLLLALLLAHFFKKLSEPDYRKVFCSLFIILASISALLTFIRNDDWQSILSIQYDNVLKAPELARTNANYANALLSVDQFEEALKYGERAMELNRPGLESYNNGANAIVSSLYNLGRYEEVVTRGGEFIANQPKMIDVDSLPFVYLNVAQALIALDRYKEAYENIIEAYKAIEKSDGLMRKKEGALIVMRILLAKVRDKDIDLNDDGVPDPGDKPVDLWIAAEVKKIGDLEYSKQLIESEHARDPGNIEVASAVDEMKREEPLNRVQKAKWNFAKNYISHPFSKFNFLMSVALIVQEKQLTGLLHQIGKKCLNAALEIDPKSTDAILLKGWYAYMEENAGEAVKAAKEAISIDPEHAKSWLGLGFFLMKAGSPNEAAIAFNKVLELYPGYSKRLIIMDFCKQIEQGLQVNPFSENGNNSSMNAQLQVAPAS